MNKSPYTAPESELTGSDEPAGIDTVTEKLNNRFLLAVLSVIIICKLYAWVLSLAGFFIFNADDLASVDMFKLIHHTSYMIFTSVLVVGLLFYSRLALVAFLITIPVNVLIYLFNGTNTNQTVLDPILLAIFIFLMFNRRPNKWFRNIALTSTSK